MRRIVLAVICFLALAGVAMYTVRAHDFDCPTCDGNSKHHDSKDGDSNGRFTICHVAGLAGSTQCQTLTLPEPAVCAHLGEQGTPQAGHEQDFCGPCTQNCQPPVAACNKPGAARPALAATAR
jgi:hypothetical protein